MEQSLKNGLSGHGMFGGYQAPIGGQKTRGKGKKKGKGKKGEEKF